MQNEAITRAPRSHEEAEQRSTPRPPARRAGFADVRQGFVIGIGLTVAVLSAASAWYLTYGEKLWLMGGFLAGLAVVAAALAIVLLLRDQMAPAAMGDSDLLFTALDMSVNGRVITDSAGNILYANRAYRGMTATTRGEAPSPLNLCRREPAARAAIDRLLDLAARGGQGQETVSLELPLIGRRWLRFVAGDAGNTGSKVVWQIMDVTNAEAVWDLARMSRDFMAKAMDDLGQGFLVLDGTERVRGANENLAQWLGYDQDGALSELSIRDLMAVPEARPLTEILQAGQTVLFKTRTGGAQLLRVTIANQRPIPEIESDFLVLVLARNEDRTARDATARGAAGDEKFERYFAEAPLAIATVDGEGRVYESNQLFQNYLPDGARSGRPALNEILSEGDLPDVLDRIKEALRSENLPAPIDVRFRSDRDSQAQLYVHRVKSTSATEERAVLYLIDVTGQKNLEIQFAQSQKMQAVGQLAGGIAHDFNNLLTAITGFCDLLLVRHGPGDQSFADIMQVKQNANRAANLVRQLLAFSRQQTLRPKVLIITDVLAELSNLLRRLIGETIELRMIHGRNLGPVRVDQGQLEQVIINLAVNARDAMPEGGTLTIRTANMSAAETRKLGHAVMPANDYVLIEVADTGIGIPQENLGKIFEPFFSTKEVGKGTGLGLSTVYGIVKQTGGFVFPSSDPGQGATFRIYLPLHHAEAVVEPAPAPAVERVKDLTGKGTILLVEDEDAVRLFASRALKNKGYNVLEASSGEQALELVGSHGDEIDILISDVVMPNMDGPTLVKVIQERRYSMKIIFISGYAEDAFRKNLGDGTEFSFLPKPFSLKQLAETVKDVMEG